MPTARDTIDVVRSLLTGEPVFLAGSLVAEDVYGKHGAHDDVDLFVPTQTTLMSVVQFLLCQGFTQNERMARTWYRWQRYGMKNWHTNSMKMTAPAALGGFEVNVVYKLTEGHATTSLSQVVESFDFGLLGAGWELETDTFRDFRGALFPHLFPGPGHAAHDVALPLMPNKRANWRNGFISQYNGLREAGRYVKYHRYGYDLSLVKDDLVTGYWEAVTFYGDSFEQEKKDLAKIYELIALKIEGDDFDDLEAAAKQIDYKDDLAVIMEALE
jgi:hypothetical protein